MMLRCKEYRVLSVALQRSLLDFSGNLGDVTKDSGAELNATVGQRKSLTVVRQAIVIIMIIVIAIMAVTAIMAIGIITNAINFF